MEKLSKKLLIVGCGRLGQKVGMVLSKLSLEIIGIKRTLPKNNLPFKLISLDIFSKDFYEHINSINPNYIIYCISADEQTELSYKRNYFDGLKLALSAVSKLSNFQHLFFISSTRVYGQFSENTLTESTPPKPSDYRGRVLLEAEKLLRDFAIKSTILRLSGIYGNNRGHMLTLATDHTMWPNVDRWTNRIHEDDVASFINYLFLQILGNKVIEELYLLTDNNSVSLYEVLKWIRMQFNLSDVNLMSDRIDGKKLTSEIIPNLDFTFKYPDFKSGYHKMISSLIKRNA